MKLGISAIFCRIIRVSKIIFVEIFASNDGNAEMLRWVDMQALSNNFLYVLANRNSLWLILMSIFDELSNDQQVIMGNAVRICH